MRDLFKEIAFDTLVHSAIFAVVFGLAYFLQVHGLWLFIGLWMLASGTYSGYGKWAGR
jgi:hypothetical protein